MQINLLDKRCVKRALPQFNLRIVEAEGICLNYEVSKLSSIRKA